MPFFPAVPGVLQNVARFVVLMFENRSFDHLLGYANLDDPAVDGVTGKHGNRQLPDDPNSPVAPVARATAYAMPFDPAHEFPDVALQLYAPGGSGDPITMGGFVRSAMDVADSFADGSRVMEAFQSDQIPVLAALAREFATFNNWHSSLPGPTWPNRFFVHAATSGGLAVSPGNAQILAGFKFPNGTIYERLEDAGRKWRIYHDGLPQSAGIDWLRQRYLGFLARPFHDMDEFAADAAAGDLPDYTFIEPRYDTGNQYRDGNSMHPMNDIRNGEALLKQVYEAIRGSPKLWPSTMLIVTFDEHGGFFDHVTPPAGVPTGDDTRYATPPAPFGFDRLGVRVPGLVVSAYTQRATVVGQPGEAPLDHTSILKTVEQRFNLKPLTARDAHAGTLEGALNLAAPRTDALLTLPTPLTDAQAKGIGTWPEPPAVPAGAKLSDNQQSFVDLALKCSLEVTQPPEHASLITEHAAVKSQAAAARYLARHRKLMAARRPRRAPAAP